jgi:DNA polymerase III gamma/tau subunit
MKKLLFVFAGISLLLTAGCGVKNEPSKDTGGTATPTETVSPSPTPEVSPSVEPTGTPEPAPAITPSVSPTGPPKPTAKPASTPASEKKDAAVTPEQAKPESKAAPKSKEEPESKEETESKSEPELKKETPAAKPAPTKAEAQQYVNKKVSALTAAIGQPLSKSYAPSCLGEGEDGEFEYNGFTVYTYRENGVETVQGVE